VNSFSGLEFCFRPFDRKSGSMAPRSEKEITYGGQAHRTLTLVPLARLEPPLIRGREEGAGDAAP
jgi:hypothetical protein